MNRQLIAILVVIMSIALTGLIIVQSYWISNAYKIKELQFENLADAAISKVIDFIQEDEFYRAYRTELSAIENTSNYSDNIRKRLRDDSIRIRKKIDELSHSINKDKSLGLFWRDIASEIPQNEANVLFRLERELERRIPAPFRALALPSRDEIFMRLRARIELSYTSLKDIQDRIEPALLEKTINTVFNEYGVTLPYQYAVISENKTVVYKSKNYNAGAQQKVFVRKLFPHDMFYDTSYYLSLYFPYEGQYLFRSMSFMIVSSIALIFIIICTFSATVYLLLRQKKMSKIRNDFVNNMTHELKTPISTISLASQMLSDKEIPFANKNLDHLASVISDESKRLSYQVEKVLQMSIFDKGKMSLRLKEMNGNELINTVIKNSSIQISNKNGTLTKNLIAAKCIIMADEVHFTNVIFNLLDNAIKYSKGKPDITISTVNRDNQFIISVADKGIGIDKQHQSRIFEQFYRVHTGNVHNVKGFGLGLSYVKRIIEAHNGKIYLESEVNKGTTFFIFMPLES